MATPTNYPSPITKAAFIFLILLTSYKAAAQEMTITLPKYISETSVMRLEEKTYWNLLNIKLCAKTLETMVKSPSSLQIVTVDEAPTQAVTAALQPYIVKNQRYSEPTRIVAITYDASNSYGAMLRGKITCFYNDPIYRDGTAAYAKMIMLEDRIASSLEAELFSLKAATNPEMYIDLVRLHKAETD